MTRHKEDEERGYAADSKAPNGTTGTLRACAGSACNTTNALDITFSSHYINTKVMHTNVDSLTPTRGKSNLSLEFEDV